VEEAVRAFKEMVTSGCGLTEIAESLRSSDTFVLTPFNLLRLAHEALGVSLTESRTLLEAFDANMNPIVPSSEVDRIGDAVFAPYRSGTQR
jgi:hypothetical protein